MDEENIDPSPPGRVQSKKTGCVRTIHLNFSFSSAFFFLFVRYVLCYLSLFHFLLHRRKNKSVSSSKQKAVLGLSETSSNEENIRKPPSFPTKHRKRARSV